MTACRATVSLFVLLVLGGGCGRNGLVVGAHADAGANVPDGTPATADTNVARQYHCKGPLSFQALPVISTADPSTGWTYHPYHPALGDFDGDGVLDLVGAPEVTAPMTLLYGTGGGAFPARLAIGSVWQPWQAAVADLDGDGLSDLVHTAGDEAVVTVRLGSGNRNAPFDASATYPTSKVPTSLLLADFDADGHVDLVARVNGGLEYWRGQDGGGFAHQATLETRDGSNPPTFATDAPQAMDWNGDGWLDLVYGTTASLRYRLNRGDGSFDQEVSCVFLAGVVGDMDHDGRPDVVSGSNLMLGIEGCHASKVVPLPNWPQFAMVALADLDGDGNLDVVADADTKIAVRIGDGKGGLAQPLSLTATNADMSDAFLFGDVNRDRKLDFIFVRPGGWGVFLNTCD